ARALPERLAWLSAAGSLESAVNKRDNPYTPGAALPPLMFSREDAHALRRRRLWPGSSRPQRVYVPSRSQRRNRRRRKRYTPEWRRRAPRASGVRGDLGRPWQPYRLLFAGPIRVRLIGNPGSDATDAPYFAATSLTGYRIGS